jgi:hypothetical protein
MLLLKGIARGAGISKKSPLRRSRLSRTPQRYRWALQPKRNELHMRASFSCLPASPLCTTSFMRCFAVAPLARSHRSLVARPRLHAPALARSKEPPDSLRRFPMEYLDAGCAAMVWGVFSCAVHGLRQPVAFLVRPKILFCYVSFDNHPTWQMVTYMVAGFMGSVFLRAYLSFGVQVTNCGLQMVPNKHTASPRQLFFAEVTLSSVLRQFS